MRNSFLDQLKDLEEVEYEVLEEEGKIKVSRETLGVFSSLSTAHILLAIIQNDNNPMFSAGIWFKFIDEMLQEVSVKLGKKFEEISGEKLRENELISLTKSGEMKKEKKKNLDQMIPSMEQFKKKMDTENQMFR